MRDWADVVACVSALPDVAESTSYGKPAVKHRGKLIAGTTAPGPGSFVLVATADEKDVLLATDPDTFWETEHYRGYGALLVRYGTPARERIALMLARRWWDTATAAERRAFGERP